MKILVISSCTSKKLSYSAPAAQMYTGGQHRYLMEGLEQVRGDYGRQTIDLAIISARYGLLAESDVICPYDDTFSGLTKRQILERSNSLQIHEKTEALIARYDLVFFLLGKEYVWSLRLPFAFGDTEALTQIFLAGNNSKDCIPNTAYFILADPVLASPDSVMNIDLKGFVFKKLCGVVCQRGLEVFEIIKQNPQKFVDFMLDGTYAELNCSSAPRRDDYAEYDEWVRDYGQWLRNRHNR